MLFSRIPVQRSHAQDRASDTKVVRERCVVAGAEAPSLRFAAAFLADAANDLNRTRHFTSVSHLITAYCFPGLAGPSLDPVQIAKRGGESIIITDLFLSLRRRIQLRSADTSARQCIHLRHAQAHLAALFADRVADVVVEVGRLVPPPVLDVLGPIRARRWESMRRGSLQQENDGDEEQAGAGEE